MIPLRALPALNATLNATSAVLLLAGWLAIRRRAVRVHRACMVAAFGTSVVFLVSYLVYHAQAGTTRFPGQGWIRPLYFGILGTHTVLAAIVPVLAVLTLRLAFRARFDRHARLARWTLPVWLYVSVTGVVVYALLYWLYPQAGTAGVRSPALSPAADVGAPGDGRPASPRSPGPATGSASDGRTRAARA